MLKCEWRAGLPHAVQLPYPPGDSFNARAAAHSARAAADAGSAYVALEDADLGEGGCILMICTLVPRAAAGPAWVVTGLAYLLRMQGRRLAHGPVRPRHGQTCSLPLQLQLQPGCQCLTSLRTGDCDLFGIGKHAASLANVIRMTEGGGMTNL